MLDSSQKKKSLCKRALSENYERKFEKSLVAKNIKADENTLHVNTRINVSTTMSSEDEDVETGFNKGPFTKEEDAKILAEVEFQRCQPNFVKIDYCKVARVVGTRTNSQCWQRVRKVLQSTHKKGHFSLDEDAQLCELVKHSKVLEWKEIASKMSIERTSKQCKARWQNYLNPTIKKSEFSQEEDELLLALAIKHKNSWSKIAREIPYRTQEQVKKRHIRLNKLGRNRGTQRSGVQQGCNAVNASSHQDTSVLKEAVRSGMCMTQERPHQTQKQVKKPGNKLNKRGRNRRKPRSGVQHGYRNEVNASIHQGTSVSKEIVQSTSNSGLEEPLSNLTFQDNQDDVVGVESDLLAPVTQANQTSSQVTPADTLDIEPLSRANSTANMQLEPQNNQLDTIGEENVIPVDALDIEPLSRANSTRSDISDFSKEILEPFLKDLDPSNENPDRASLLRSISGLVRESQNNQLNTIGEENVIPVDALDIEPVSRANSTRSDISDFSKEILKPFLKDLDPSNENPDRASLLRSISGLVRELERDLPWTMDEFLSENFDPEIDNIAHPLVDQPN